MEKAKILEENKDKAGVYRWINKINDKTYIGSSIQLRIRFYRYYNVAYLERNLNMPICQALLKYGYSNFSLEILEYCDPADTLRREGYYIAELKPDYNILQSTSLPRLGVKHTDISLAKISKGLKGLAKTDIHKLSLSLADPNSIQIEVIDLVLTKTTVYHSMRAAAKELEINPIVISKFISRAQVKAYKGRYIFKVKE